MILTQKQQQIQTNYKTKENKLKSRQIGADPKIVDQPENEE